MRGVVTSEDCAVVVLAVSVHIRVSPPADIVFCFKDFILLPHMGAHERLKIKYLPEEKF